MRLEPAALGCELDAGPESVALQPFCDRNGALIFSIWMRRSWTASMPAAGSRSLRAAASDWNRAVR